MSTLEAEFPKAVVARIIKDALPQECAVAGDAKTAINVAGRVFVAYATDMASEVASSSGRKKITAEDVLKAIEDLDLPFGDELKQTLEGIKAAQKVKRQQAYDRRQQAADRKAAKAAQGEGEEGATAQGEGEEMAKKAKTAEPAGSQEAATANTTMVTGSDDEAQQQQQQQQQEEEQGSASQQNADEHDAQTDATSTGGNEQQAAAEVNGTTDEAA